MTEDRLEVLKKIANGQYTLSKKRKCRSTMWNVLSEIRKEDGTTIVGLVYCSVCSKVLKYIGSQTSNLIRHKCCQSDRQAAELKKVAPEHKSAAIDACTTWVVEDCRPFSSVTGTGFSKLVKFFIGLGAKYGENVDINDLLPDATTVSRNVQKLAADCKAKIKDEISEVVSSGGATSTIDIWTDNYVKRNFVGVTLHYRKELILVDAILGIKSMDFESSTADNIQRKLKNLFGEFGVSNFENLKFITDRGKNVVKALENNTRLNCSSHLLSNILNKSFEETAELTEILNSCKKIVKYFKKANLQHRLSTSLKSPCPTRWNSNYVMLKSIAENWFIINEILSEKGESQRLLFINFSTLKLLVELFKDFEIIFKKLQLCSSPSLCFVIPSIKKMKSLCECDNSDIAAITALKTNISDKIDKIWKSNINLWHKAAFFLYPPAAQMQADDLKEIQSFCISEINKLNNSTASPYLSQQQLSASTPTILSAESDSQSLQSQSLHTKDIQFFLPDLWEKSTVSTTETPQEEVERYSKKIVKITEDFDVLKWWQIHEKEYPYLSKLAFQIHSMPASSAAAERAFSLAGNVITEKRSRLGPKSLDSLLFMHSYYKNFDN